MYSCTCTSPKYTLFMYRGVETLNQLPDILTYMYMYFQHSCPAPYILSIHTVYFQFTGHSLDFSDNVLHDWLFSHHCIYMYTCTTYLQCTCIYMYTVYVNKLLPYSNSNYIIHVGIMYLLSVTMTLYHCSLRSVFI